MSGKVSSAVLVMAAVFCVLTVAVQAHGNFTKEQCIEFTNKMKNASCDVKYNKTEVETVYADCIKNKTGRDVPEDQRSNGTFYCELDFSMDQWKSVEECAHEKNHFQEVWTSAQAPEFVKVNMTFKDNATHALFDKGVEACSTQYATNATGFTQCGKKLYFEVCYNITYTKSLE